MNNKELYLQKMQAQLDEWKADVSKMKAKTSGASADVQLEMNARIHGLESKIDEGTTKLSELVKSGDEAWETLKGGIESSWKTLKSSVNEAVTKFKG